MGGVRFFLKIREIEGFVKDRPALISFPPDIQISGSVEPLGPLGFAELKEGFPREAGLASFEKASVRLPLGVSPKIVPLGSAELLKRSPFGDRTADRSEASFFRSGRSTMSSFREAPSRGADEPTDRDARPLAGHDGSI